MVASSGLICSIREQPLYLLREYFFLLFLSMKTIKNSKGQITSKLEGFRSFATYLLSTNLEQIHSLVEWFSIQFNNRWTKTESEVSSGSAIWLFWTLLIHYTFSLRPVIFMLIEELRCNDPVTINCQDLCVWPSSRIFCRIQISLAIVCIV